jgi:hypothetical protein
MAGIEPEALMAAGRAWLDERPRTRAQLAPLMAERWPDHDGPSLAYALTYLLALVQVTPRGLWQRSGASAFSTVEAWLGRSVEPAPDISTLLIRYLAAFGPASVADIRAWSGIGGLREVVDRLRPRLVTFRDERGRELFDLPDAPRPDSDTPAPVRYPPEYDNVLLGHATGPLRRRRAGGSVVAAHRPRHDRRRHRRGTWRVRRDREGATMDIRTLDPLSPAAGADVEDEGAALLDILADRPRRVIHRTSLSG